MLRIGWNLADIGHQDITRYDDEDSPGRGGLVGLARIFPFGALPAWCLAKIKFEGMVTANYQSKDEINQLCTRFQQNLQPWAVKTDSGPSVYKAIRQLSHMELTHSNSAELLINGVP